MAKLPTWIFGYGSVVWKPGDINYSRRVEGYVKGYRRVWHQGSTDHRGTPDAPGRTVTLEESAGSVTWGVAYEMAGSYEEKVAAMQYLEHREKQYDVRAVVDVYARNGGANGAPAVCGALVFIGSPNKSTNRNYLGPCPLPALARQIAESAGPSGPNSEYLFGLADAMRKMQVDDPELFELEQAVRAILRSPELPER